jgi:hypothetical protein
MSSIRYCSATHSSFSIGYPDIYHYIVILFCGGEVFFEKKNPRVNGEIIDTLFLPAGCPFPHLFERPSLA